MAIDEAEVRAVAEDEIKSLCDASGISAEDYAVTVMRDPKQPRIWIVYWDLIKPNDDGTVSYRATGVDISEDKEVLRERIRHEFAKDAKRAELYGTHEVLLS